MNGDVFDMATGPVPGDREYAIGDRWTQRAPNPNPFPRFRLFRWLPWR